MERNKLKESADIIEIHQGTKKQMGWAFSKNGPSKTN